MDKYKKYSHLFPNGLEVDAREYENDLLPHLIEYIEREWLPNNSHNYFKDRDPKALDYLPKLLSDRRN